MIFSLPGFLRNPKFPRVERSWESAFSLSSRTRPDLSGTVVRDLLFVSVWAGAGPPFGEVRRAFCVPEGPAGRHRAALPLRRIGRASAILPGARILPSQRRCLLRPRDVRLLESGGTPPTSR